MTTRAKGYVFNRPHRRSCSVCGEPFTAAYDGHGLYCTSACAAFAHLVRDTLAGRSAFHESLVGMMAEASRRATSPRGRVQKAAADGQSRQWRFRRNRPESGTSRSVPAPTG
jgi:hypothetical protein